MNIFDIRRRATMAWLMAFVMVLPCGAQERVEDAILLSEDPAGCEGWARQVEASGGGLFVNSEICITGGNLEPMRIRQFKRGAQGMHLVGTAWSPHPFIGDIFGIEGFAVRGQRMVVPTPRFPDQFNPEGRAYVIEFGGGVWQTVAELRQVASVPRDGYGNTVAMTEDTVFVAAAAAGPILANGFSSERGDIYVYKNNGQGWVESQLWSAPDTPDYIAFGAGRFMGADGDVLATGNNHQNRLLILERNAAGVWATSQVIDNAVWVNDEHGWDIEVDDGTIIVGTDRHTHSIRGEVRIFSKVAGIWTLIQVLQSPDSQGSGDAFGQAVDIKGDRLIVGDPHAGGAGHPGAAYVYKRDSFGVWALAWKLRRRDSSLGHSLGGHVALGDDFAAVGDIGALNGPGTFQGAVLVYELPVGQEVCSGVPNSSGASATLEIQGSRVAGTGYLRLTASGLRPGFAGVFLASQAVGMTFNPGGSQGNLCLGGPVLRLNFPSQYGPADAAGSRSLSLDFNAAPFNNSTPLVAGQTWVFQYWYRDWNGGPTTNLTSAWQLTFD